MTLAMNCFIESYSKLSVAMPQFGMQEAAALGALVQKSIMKDRNEPKAQEKDS